MTDGVLDTSEARALAAPARQSILRQLADAAEPLGVAAMTEHLGLNHNATRKHLAVLVAAGLVVEERELRTVRGRPRLLYRLAARPGGYERLAVLLATALATGRAPIDVARAMPPAPPVSPPAGEPIDALVAQLAAEGFQPAVRARGRRADIVLGRCPYAEAAAANPDAVCAIHRGLAEAATAAIGGLSVVDLRARDPHRAGCRLTVGPPART